MDGRRIALAVGDAWVTPLREQLEARACLVDVISERDQFDGGAMLLVEATRGDADTLLAIAAGAGIPSLLCWPQGRPEPPSLRADAYASIEQVLERDPFELARVSDARMRPVGPPRLVFVGGAGIPSMRDGGPFRVGAEMNLVPPRSILGRGTDVELHVHSSQVARHHALLSMGQRITVEDLASANGTWVRSRAGLLRLGADVPSATLAFDDDLIVAGMYWFRLEGSVRAG